MATLLQQTRFQRFLTLAALFMGGPLMALGWIHSLFFPMRVDDYLSIPGFLLWSQILVMLLLILGNALATGNILVHLVVWRWKTAVQSLGILALLVLIEFAAVLINPIYVQ